MKLHTLKPAKGSTHSRRRSGYRKKIGFEGGQMPMQRRLPKYGFNNIFRVEYKGINLSVLQELAETKNWEKITPKELHEAGYISKKQLVKILGKGELKAKLEVEANAFSKSAQAAIEAAGGKATKL